ncbi:DUF4845 domain-containing protein [Gynuella sunshinyii]|uniref:DUF4845 domain-containing protein n=1 Tax=Gynuella sunshinyii YC6258 TaxID=1445510 RepID=A0A0C5VVP4_9GAMM|nr:DUF4845 domain-containing protein [Gynuella sunshinyii]AJQ94539.1 hypothetical Protein YC6258_02501 [Gynuella sunshinyii YC6258]
MKSLKKQRGMSVYTVAFLILIVSFFATLVVKLGPVYMDQWYLNGMLQSMADESGTAEMSISDLRNSLSKRMLVNNVEFDAKEGLKLDTKSNPKKMVLDYSKQVHIMFNVDALVKFHKEYSLLP